MTPPSPGPDAFGSGLLTAADFHAALSRSLDASKPDPLARRQMENLRLGWEQQGEDGEVRRPDGTLRGTLTLSSDIVSVAVNVDCNYRCNGQQTIANKADDATSDNSRFEHEFNIELTAHARFVPVADHNAPIKGEKVDRKERAMKKKLRAGMIDRLRADSLVRRLLAEEDGCRGSKGASKNDENGPATTALPLCEALIQQNGQGNTHELEERVNVHDNTLEGIRRAIFSHTEDNLDVLDLLLNLNMPYLPRATPASGSDSNTALSVMAERAYLRLLEDAMFDACEREGEDELLDDLDISDAHHDDCAIPKDEGDGREGKRKKIADSRR